MVSSLFLAADDLGARPSDFVIPAVALMLFALLYLTPTVVAVVRRVPDTGTLAAINLFLGWTVIGWIATMVMALGVIDPRRQRRRPGVRDRWPHAQRQHRPYTPSEARRYGEGDALDDPPVARPRP